MFHLPDRHKLTASKRAHTVQKLSCILQQKPSGRQSPTFSSLDLLPTSLVNWIRKSNSLTVCTDSAPSPGPSLTAGLSCSLSLLPSLSCAQVHVNKLGQNKEIKLRGGRVSRCGFNYGMVLSACVCWTGCGNGWQRGRWRKREQLSQKGVTISQTHQTSTSGGMCWQWAGLEWMGSDKCGCGLPPIAVGCDGSSHTHTHTHTQAFTMTVLIRCDRWSN